MTIPSFPPRRQPQSRPALPKVVWPGLRRSYDMELYPLGTAFRPVPGVYVICFEEEPNRWFPLYVGEAECLNTRVGKGFGAHHKGTVCSTYGATHICVRIVSGPKAARLAVERDLRHGLQPPLNDQ